MATYLNAPLYRTLPKLGGNMMWDLIVEKGNDGELTVVDFHLRPISSRIPFTLIQDDNLLVRPHQLNIVDFYEKTKGSFFDSPIDPQLESDWPIFLSRDFDPDEKKYIKNWCDDYWCGVSRMPYSTYKKTHQAFIPLWVEKVEKNIQIGLNITSYTPLSGVENYILDLHPYSDPQTFHERFCNYLFDYLEYTEIYGSGNNRCMTIDFQKKTCYLSGIEVSSGNFITRSDSNIVNNLVSRERPLMEQNSILTNAFPDVLLILPQLLNFNLIFDFNEMASNVTSSHVTTLVEFDGDGSMDNPCEQCDIFTNHEFIPRFPANDGAEMNEERSLTDLPHNALDYLQDNKVTALIHKNKINPTICHWSHLEDGNSLFNVYDGFGCYGEDGSFIPHAFGQIDDPLNPTYNESLFTYNWLGKVYNTKDDGDVNGGDSIVQFTHPLSYYTNNLRWDDIDENYWFGILLREKDCTTEESFTTIGVSSITLSIHSSRETSVSDGVTLSTMLPHNAIQSRFKDLSYMYEMYGDAKMANQYCNYDTQYDINRGNDYNNRFGDLLHSINNSVESSWVSTHNNNNDTYKKLTIYLYKDDTRYYTLFASAHKECLTLGNILELMKDYVDYYNGRILYGGDQNDNKISCYQYLLDWMSDIISELSKVSSPDVVYFNKSISYGPDRSLDNKALELKYYKKDNANNYVLRYGGCIRPAILPPPYDEENGVIYDRYGINYLWQKDVISLSDITDGEENGNNYFYDPSHIAGYKKFVQLNIPPTFPSLDYESLYLYSSEEKIQAQKTSMSSRGDTTNSVYLYPTTSIFNITYDSPHPRFFGVADIKGETPENWEKIVRPNGSTTITSSQCPPEMQWEEFKWFQNSKITGFPKALSSFVIGVHDNTKEELENATTTYYCDLIYTNYIYMTPYLHPSSYFIKSLYNIEYNLIRTVHINHIVFRASAEKLLSGTGTPGNLYKIPSGDSYLYYIYVDNQWEDVTPYISTETLGMMYMYEVNMSLK